MWVAGPTVREKRTTWSVSKFQSRATSEVLADDREVTIKAGWSPSIEPDGETSPTTRRFERHRAVTLPLPGVRTTGQITVKPNR